MSLSTSLMTAWVAPQFLLGVVVSIGINISLVSSWKTATEYDIASLKAYRLVAIQDHDAIIRIGADMTSIKVALERIEYRLNKDMASG